MTVGAVSRTKRSDASATTVGTDSRTTRSDTFGHGSLDRTSRTTRSDASATMPPERTRAPRDWMLPDASSTDSRTRRSGCAGDALGAVRDDHVRRHSATMPERTRAQPIGCFKPPLPLTHETLGAPRRLRGRVANEALGSFGDDSGNRVTNETVLWRPPPRLRARRHRTRRSDVSATTPFTASRNETLGGFRHDFPHACRETKRSEVSRHRSGHGVTNEAFGGFRYDSLHGIANETLGGFRHDSGHGVANQALGGFGDYRRHSGAHQAFRCSATAPATLSRIAARIAPFS